MVVIEQAVVEAEGRSRPDPFGMWGHVGLRFSYGIEFRPDVVAASAADGDMDVDSETDTDTDTKRPRSSDGGYEADMDVTFSAVEEEDVHLELRVRMLPDADASGANVIVVAAQGVEDCARCDGPARIKDVKQLIDYVAAFVLLMLPEAFCGAVACIDVGMPGAAESLADLERRLDRLVAADAPPADAAWLPRDDIGRSRADFLEAFSRLRHRGG